eukprot:SAG31_NODE_138_length_22877_cov_29.540917_13_plen_362_part_00
MIQNSEDLKTSLLNESVGAASTVPAVSEYTTDRCYECSGPYPHDDNFQELFPNVFFIEGAFIVESTKQKFYFGRNMVIVRNGQSLTVVNSVRLNDDGLRKLDELGRVEHVIRLCAHHGTDDPFYKMRYGAQVWAVERTKYVRQYFPGAEQYFTPDHWMNTSTVLPIADAELIIIETGLETDRAYQSGGPEGTLLLNGPKVLIGGDNLQNMDDWHQPGSKHVDPRIVPGLKKLGFLCPCQPGPMWRVFTKQCGGAAAFERQESQLRALLDLPWDHVLPSHGNPKLGNAKEAFSKSLTSAEFTVRMRIWALMSELQLKKCRVLLLLLLLASIVWLVVVAILFFDEHRRFPGDESGSTSGSQEL